MIHDFQSSNSPESSKTYSSGKSWLYHPRPTQTTTTSPIYDYFNSSHIYLTRKYSDYSTKYFSKSNIFLRKDTLTDTSSNSQNTLDETDNNPSPENSLQYNDKETSLQTSQPFLPIKNHYLPLPNNNNPTINNLFIPNQNNVINEYVTEMYGRKGWICVYCDNFNYITRKKCNKCGVIKTAKKISNISNYVNVTSSSESNIQCNNKNQVENTKTNLQSDWVCFQCKNLNFSFRVVCNRCELPRMKSEMLMVNSYQNVINNFICKNQQNKSDLLYFANTNYTL